MSEQITTTNAEFRSKDFAVDIDNDYSIDVVSASSEDDKIAWYKNLKGPGTFGLQQIIDDNLINSGSLFVADMDGDVDEDILTGTRINNQPDFLV